MFAAGLQPPARPHARSRRSSCLRPDPSDRTIEHMSERIVPVDELEAAIEARKELGADMEPAVIDAFVERIERRLTQRAGQGDQALEHKRQHQKELVLGAMKLSIPLFVVAAIFTGLPGVIAVSAAIAVIALVSAR